MTPTIAPSDHSAPMATPSDGVGVDPGDTAGGEPESLNAVTVVKILRRTYPEAKCELDFTTVFQLLIATILSAQSTDRRVNQVTPVLFAQYPDPAALAAADVLDIERIIHSTGFFRVKAQSIITASQMIMTDFSGQVPRTLDRLTRLPSVGRKTANVVLSDGFGVPAVTTDTHVIRLAHRLGWSSAKEPAAVEHDLCQLLPRRWWITMDHVVIWHGRRCCHAIRPACGVCPVAQHCPSYGAGPTEPEVAARLLRGPRA